VRLYHKIPGHIEAGLRTECVLSSPKKSTVSWQRAGRPALRSDGRYANLLKEGVASENIFVTGNTVIDALDLALERVKTNPQKIPGLPPETMSNDCPLVLITGHRRESFGEGFQNICLAISELAQRFPSAEFVYPVHLNPNVREPVFNLLGNRPNIHLIDPLGYLPFVALMNRAKIILTDSGGVQEEAPSLGKPVLVMRDTTERPEAVAIGTVKLWHRHGCHRNQCIPLMTDRTALQADGQEVNPYGEGRELPRELWKLS
jgi:UDP-N-acetylglucosamine 2-epimerase (non-hydrolysing)